MANVEDITEFYDRNKCVVYNKQRMNKKNNRKIVSQKCLEHLVNETFQADHLALYKFFFFYQIFSHCNYRNVTEQFEFDFMMFHQNLLLILTH